MSDLMYKKLEDEIFINRLIKQLNAFARKNVLAVQALIGTIFSGLVLKFAFNPRLDQELGTELVRLGIVLLLFMLFIFLNHQSRLFQMKDDMDENTTRNLDNMHHTFIMWVDKQTEIIEDPMEVVSLFESANQVFNVITAVDVKKTFARGVMSINDMMINTFREPKKSRFQKIKKTLRRPISETTEETEDAMDEALEEEPPVIPPPRLSVSEDV